MHRYSFVTKKIIGWRNYIKFATLANNEVIGLKEKYLIALDLDGTLLNGESKIAAKSKRIVNHLMEQGHIVVIATGRTNSLSIHFYHELGLTTPLINSNGAVLHHPLDKNWGTYHLPLKLNTAMDIIDTCYKFNSKNILAAVWDNVYLDKFDPYIAQFYGHEKENEAFVVGKVREQLQDDPTVMLLYPEEDHLAALTNELDQLQAEVFDHRNWGAPFHVIEVMNKQMNKREALKKIAAYYHIPQQRIIAFGDGSNDLEMIEYAGVGVAMANAIDELKSLAKFQTTSNVEHGVAHFLTEYFNVKGPLVS